MENSNSMNFSLEDLEGLVKSAQSMKEDTSNSKMDNFTRIIKGVSRKYASKWIDREDLEQDLWVRILDLINDCGGIENTDEKLVARVCFNTAVDKYRYHRRRHDSKAEYIEGSDVDDGDKGPNYFDTMHGSIESVMDVILYKEVIDLFDKGSRERKYVVLKLVNSGLLDPQYLDKDDQELVEVPSEETETGYILLLGYKSHSPGSWISKKRQINRIVHEFLGYDIP